MQCLHDKSPNWAEELPDNCPPREAYPPNNGLFYRLVDTIPPNDYDFDSANKRSPKRHFNIDECTQKALSIFSSIEACDNVRKTWTQMENMKIVQVLLPPESGVIRQTTSDPSHFSWWRCRDFDPIINCIEVKLD